MKVISSSLMSLIFIFPAPSIATDDTERELTNYQKAIRGLREKEIRAKLPSEKMLDLCIPSETPTRLLRVNDYRERWRSKASH